jgi:hypothetical protein
MMTKMTSSRASSALWLAAALAITSAGTASAAQVKLSERTSVRVRLLETLVSGGKKKGEEVRFEVVEDVLGPQHEVLISRGTPVFGTIQRSSGRGMFGKPGKLEISVDKTHAADGTKVPLRATEAKSGRNNSGAAIATAVLLAPIALFVHGRDVRMEKGKELVAFVDEDVLIDPSKAATASSASTASTSATATGKLLVIQLKNGDKITGTIDGLQDGVYSVTTSSGTLKIAQADVTSITEKQ